MKTLFKLFGKLVKLCVVVLIALFVIGLVFGDDEEAEYEDYTASSTEITTESYAAANSTEVEDAHVEELSSMMEELPEGAVREKLNEIDSSKDNTVTILIYMNGSDLETDDSEATVDLSEMIAAGYSDNVHVIVETLGTKKWHDYGIASDRTQIYELNGDGLKLVKDDLGQRDCTSADTLSDFIKWGTKNYPADRYFLQFWNHGAGPVYGYGYDQFQDEEASLTTDEIKKAISDSGVKFDCIGMDCCIMSSLEVCMALYDYCDYMILSEEFESGLGWAYTGFLKALYDNSAISVPDLGKIVIDDTVNANKFSVNGDDTVLAVIDESMMKVLYTAWTDFAYANEDVLLDRNYSRMTKRSKRAKGAKRIGFLSELLSDWFSGEATFDDYYVTDLMAVAQNINSKESQALSAAVKNTICYMNSWGSVDGFTGISVTLPYGDSEFYSQLKEVFTNCGLDADYIAWLKKFVSASGYDDYYDYDTWDDEWEGWDDYEDDFNWFDWLFSDDDEFWDEMEDSEDWCW